MTQHRRILSASTLALTVGALVLTGCTDAGGDNNTAGGDNNTADGDNDTAGGDDNTAATGAAGEDPREEVSFSFTFAASNNFESPFQSLAEAYMEENSHVTIETNPQPNDNYDTTVRTQLQAGNASDLIQTVPGAGQPRAVLALAEAGLLAPLGDASTAVIPEGTEALYQVDGETYGQPVDFTVAGFVANMTSAEEAGITEFATDFETFLEQCATLADQGKSMIALAGAAPPNTGLTAMAISATRVYAAEPDWNEQRLAGETTFAGSQGWVDTLQTVIDLNEAGCFQPGAEGGGFDVITNGLASGSSVGGFLPGGAAVEIARAAPEGVNFAIQPFPADGGEAHVLASANYTLSITEESDNAEAVQEFLDWVTTPEASALFYEVSGALPVVGHEDIDTEETIYEPVAGLLDSGQFSPLPNTRWPSAGVYDALSTGVQGLLTGQRTIEDVLNAMDAGWDN